MKLIVGLGNIGAQYTKTRHNLGFMVIDQLAKNAELPPCKLNDKFHAQIAEGLIGAVKVLLAKPVTMMNLSGQSVGKLARFYKLGPSEVWIIHDDLDLDFGKLRVRQGGGSAGHNGLKSIIAEVGEGFGRFRIGIANADLKNPVPSEAFVLSQFDAAEISHVSNIVDKSANYVNKYLDSGSLDDTTHNLLDN